MALFVLLALTPLIISMGLMVYLFVTSIKEKEYMDAAFSLAVILGVIGVVKVLNG